LKSENISVFALSLIDIMNRKYLFREWL